MYGSGTEEFPIAKGIESLHDDGMGMTLPAPWALCVDANRGIEFQAAARSPLLMNANPPTMPEPWLMDNAGLSCEGNLRLFRPMPLRCRRH